jgi:hypothetical protein
MYIKDTVNIQDWIRANRKRLQSHRRGIYVITHTYSIPKRAIAVLSKDSMVSVPIDEEAYSIDLVVPRQEWWSDTEDSAWHVTRGVSLVEDILPFPVNHKTYLGAYVISHLRPS